MTRDEMLRILASLSTEQLQAIAAMVAQLNAHPPQWLSHSIQVPTCTHDKI